MDLAVEAVFDSWNADRAILYRRQERIPADLGTAVNVVAMVFGNLGMDSGTGVAFTRDPGTGQQGVYGDYLQNAQGEDVVAGIRNTVPLQDLEQIDETSYDRADGRSWPRWRTTTRTCATSSSRSSAASCGCCRPGSASAPPAAAFRIATQLVDQGLIDMDEALTRVTGSQLAQLMFPRFDAGRDVKQIAKAHQRLARARPSARPCSTRRRAVELGRPGREVILVRRETNPDDLHGMIAAQGILTSRGGKTSHAAVVARGMGKTCVCGADELEVDVNGQQVHRRPTARSSARAT